MSETKKQPDLFEDYNEGARRRDEAIQRVSDNANPAWTEQAYVVGVGIARKQQKLSASDIDIEMSRTFPHIVTHEKRAMGAVVRRLQKDKVLFATNEVALDPRPSFHGGLRRVLQSLIFEPA